MKFKLRYAGIRVRDLQKSLDFYIKVLGMKIAHRGTMDHGGEFVQLKSPGSEQMLELNWYPEGSRFYTKYTKGEEMDHLAFVVEDVGKAYKELIAKGAEVAVAPHEAEGTEVYVKDPDGIWLELLE